MDMVKCTKEVTLVYVVVVTLFSRSSPAHREIFMPSLIIYDGTRGKELNFCTSSKTSEQTITHNKNVLSWAAKVDFYYMLTMHIGAKRTIF